MGYVMLPGRLQFCEPKTAPTALRYTASWAISILRSKPAPKGDAPKRTANPEQFRSDTPCLLQNVTRNVVAEGTETEL